MTKQINGYQIELPAVLLLLSVGLYLKMKKYLDVISNSEMPSGLVKL